jgi:nucleoside-diphosphate-sugar epimerase
MKVFIAGATGAVGKPLVKLLRDGGHEVVGMTRSAARGAPLRALGAQVVIADAFDGPAVADAVASAQPDVVVNQLTALENLRSFRNIDREFALTNRLRTIGTDNLIAAARASGAHTVLSQSYGAWLYDRTTATLKAEDDPLDPAPPARLRETVAAIRHLEEATLQAPGMTGIVLRYANFYGPGTSIAVDGAIADELRKRRVPVVGDGGGVWSFIHVDDAAAATVAALEAGVGGIFNVVDDEPAPTRDWIPELAQAVGARAPRRVPAWLARPLAGEIGVLAMTRLRGMSNAKARATFGWQPAYPSYREGFRDGIGADAAHVGTSR